MLKPPSGLESTTLCSMGRTRTPSLPPLCAHYQVKRAFQQVKCGVFAPTLVSSLMSISTSWRAMGKRCPPEGPCTTALGASENSVQWYGRHLSCARGQAENPGGYLDCMGMFCIIKIILNGDTLLLLESHATMLSFLPIIWLCSIQHLPLSVNLLYNYESYFSVYVLFWLLWMMQMDLRWLILVHTCKPIFRLSHCPGKYFSVSELPVVIRGGKTGLCKLKDQKCVQNV